MSPLVRTFEATTPADPLGNEQQLVDEDRRGALVDLQPDPRHVIDAVRGGGRDPMRRGEERVDGERVFYRPGARSPSRRSLRT